MHHGNGVVHLVRHAGSELAHDGEFFRLHQLLLCLLERLVAGGQLGGALGHALVQLAAPALQRLGFVVNHIQQLVEVVGQCAQFVGGGQRAHAGLRLTVFHALHGAVHLFHGLKNAARPAHRKQGGQRHHSQKNQRHDGQQPEAHQPEGALQVTHIQHADALFVGVQQGLVGAHIPVVHHKSTVQPGVPFAQHLVAHGTRHAGADGALVLKKAHVGGDAHIVQKERGRALAAKGQRALGVHHAVDVVDEGQVLVQQHTAGQHRQRAAVGVAHHPHRHTHHGAAFLSLVCVGSVGRMHQRYAQAVAQGGGELLHVLLAQHHQLALGQGLMALQPAGQGRGQGGGVAPRQRGTGQGVQAQKIQAQSGTLGVQPGGQLGGWVRRAVQQCADERV